MSADEVWRKKGAWRPAIAYAWVLVTLFLLLLSAVVDVPEFHRDAQYYIQSALLWPAGKVTFAGSWIGTRDLVVLVYHLFFSIFGESLDALAIGLAIIKVITQAALVTILFSLVPSPFAAACLTSLTAIT